VTLLDTEMNRDKLRYWLSDQRIERPERVAVEPLRGHVSAFDILDPVGRREWVDRLKVLATEVLILDCLRPMLEYSASMRTLSPVSCWSRLTRWLHRGISELLVVHHMGHTVERSRGSSRLRDWLDVEWRLVREDVDDPASRRYFSAYGRDVEVIESALDFQPGTRHLIIAGEPRKDAAPMPCGPALVALLTKQPGISGRGLVRGLVPCLPGLGERHH
jgi:hypothetical protein